jgi:hypothetical protein
MSTNQIDEQDPRPEWTMTFGMGLWEDDSLYIQWLTVLYSIWQKVEYP